MPAAPRAAERVPSRQHVCNNSGQSEGARGAGMGPACGSGPLLRGRHHRRQTRMPNQSDDQGGMTGQGEGSGGADTGWNEEEQGGSQSSGGMSQGGTSGTSEQTGGSSGYGDTSGASDRM